MNYEQRTRWLMKVVGSAVVLALSFASCGDESAAKCAVTNCHGVKVSCGTGPTFLCTAVYESGDICRGLVSCEEISGQCKAVPSEEYQECADCVEGCKARSTEKSDLFQCEMQCAPETEREKREWIGE